MSSAHFATCNHLILLRIISDRIGQVLEWCSENAQSSSGMVRLGVVWNGGGSRVWRGRGAVLVSVRRQESVEVKGSGQTVQAKKLVVVNLCLR